MIQIQLQIIMLPHRADIRELALQEPKTPPNMIQDIINNRRPHRKRKREQEKQESGTIIMVRDQSCYSILGILNLN